MICQACGIEAPTKKVFFVRHIGAIVMFFHNRIGGELCRKCVNKYFLEYGGTTLLLGWWGMISVFATPVVLVIDIVNYFRAWNLAPVPVGAKPPQLTTDIINKLNPMVPQLVQRLNNGEKLEAVAAEIGRQVAVTPGQVATFVRVLAAQRANPPPPAATSSIAHQPMTPRQT